MEQRLIDFYSGKLIIDIRKATAEELEAFGEKVGLKLAWCKEVPTVKGHYFYLYTRITDNLLWKEGGYDLFVKVNGYYHIYGSYGMATNGMTCMTIAEFLEPENELIPITEEEMEMLYE